MHLNSFKAVMDFSKWNEGVKRFVPHFGGAPKKGWTEDLRQAVEELSRLNTSTEAEFLSLGENLQDYYLRTREISQDSSSIATRMSGQEISTAIEGLREILNRVEDLDNQSRQGVEILGSILDRAEVIGSQLDYFARVVKNLYVLCNFIKIETARIKGSEKEFSALVEDIKNLAGNIESKTRVLQEQANSLSQVTRQNLIVINNFETKQHGQSRIILDGTMKNLRSLSERNELSVHTLKNLSGQWKAISQSIGEVVSALQFHDITRQQIEHVIEALNGLSFSDGSPHNGRPVPAVRQSATLNSPTSGESRNGSLKEKAGLIVATCKLQISQLGFASDDLVSAVNRIKTHLGTISTRAGEMSQEAKSITGKKEETGSSFLEEIEKDLSALTTSLNDYASLNREMEATIGRVAETVSGMSSFVSEIERIGVDMKKVALNAIIHSAHIGDEGLSLGVLAESVHRLSVETTNQINAIADHLKIVISTSDQLAENVQTEVEKKWKGGDYLAGYIKKMIEPLQQLDEQIDQLLGRIDQSGKRFQVDIEETIQKITVHNRVEQKIVDVNDGLESLIHRITQSVPASLEYKPSQEMQELSRRYTMNREREIHQSLMFSALPAGEIIEAGAETTSEELWDMPGEEGQENKTASGEEDLGDNVDLF
jgi:ABC-type transporter Mla subunit MlaD